MQFLWLIYLLLVQTVLGKNSWDKDGNEDAVLGDQKSAAEEKDDGKVRVSSFSFDGKVEKYRYTKPENPSLDEPETIVVLTNKNEAHVTLDQGMTWTQVSPKDKFIDVVVDKGRIYLISVRQSKVVYSLDNGRHWKQFATPAEPSDRPNADTLVFHPANLSWLIWNGIQCKGSFPKKTCSYVSFMTKNYGNSWKPLLENSQKCSFVGGDNPHPELTICLDIDRNLKSSTDDFGSSDDKLSNVLDFAQKDDYLVSASVGSKKQLRMDVTRNGQFWRQAQFPTNFKADSSQAFTILSGKAGSLHIHVTTNPRKGSTFGALLKSNYEGNSYTHSLDFVNRDDNGFVDFEMVNGLEGVIVSNMVRNYDEAFKGKSKKVATLISHNDGGDWALIPPPAQDAEGNPYSCAGKPIEECSLNLFGYTQEDDPSDTLGSGSAVGLMIGVGSVGSELPGSPSEGNTYLTRDGGMSWKEVMKGQYMWEYGDQGSVIVLVQEGKATKEFQYSVDGGATWNAYVFTDKAVTINDIATVPSDNSVRFVLFADGKTTKEFQLDFSELLSRPCKTEVEGNDSDDLELWIPSHPFQGDNCMFGHEAQYSRKIPGKLCHVGKELNQPYKVLRQCSCTAKDFECDINYVRDAQGACKPVDKYVAPTFKDVCEVSDPPDVFTPETGYRRISATTCEGGVDLAKSSDSKPCPGKKGGDGKKKGGDDKKKDDGKKSPDSHGSGFLGFISWVFVLGVLGGLGKYLYHLYQNRDGEISLSDDGNFSFSESEGGVIQQFRSDFFSGVVTVATKVSSVIDDVVDKAKDAWAKYTGRDRGYTSAYVVPDDNGFADDGHDDVSPYHDVQ